MRRWQTMRNYKWSSWIMISNVSKICKTSATVLCTRKGCTHAIVVRAGLVWRAQNADNSTHNTNISTTANLIKDHKQKTDTLQYTTDMRWRSILSCKSTTITSKLPVWQRPHNHKHRLRPARYSHFHTRYPHRHKRDLFLFLSIISLPICVFCSYTSARRYCDQSWMLVG